MKKILMLGIFILFLSGCEKAQDEISINVDTTTIYIEAGVDEFVVPECTVNNSVGDCLLSGDTVNDEVPGTYYVIFSATDEDGHYASEKILRVYVVDTTIPTILSTKTNLKTSDFITTSELVNEYSLNGGIDFVSIDDTNEVLLNNIEDGIYDFVVKDLYGNSSNQITITVDSTFPVINIDTYEESNLYKKISMDDYQNLSIKSSQIDLYDGYYIFQVSEEDYTAKLILKNINDDDFEEVYDLGDYTSKYIYDIAIEDHYIVIGVVNMNGPEYVQIIDMDDSEYSRTIFQESDSLNSFATRVQVDGDFIVVSDYKIGQNSGIYNGGVYVYKFSDEAYSRLIDPNIAGSRFGYSISLLDSRLLVSTYNAGVFEYDLTDELYINQSNAGITGMLKVTQNNEYYAVSDYDVYGATGYVYVYKFDDPYYYERIIYPNDIVLGIRFGYTITMSENYLVVTALGEFGSEDITNNVYVYDLENQDYFQKLDNPSTSNQDENFGMDSAIDNKYIYLTARGEIQPEGSRGALYIYEIQTIYTISLDEGNILSVVLIKDDVEIEFTNKLVLAGNYEVIVEDLAGNITSQTFTID